MALFVLNMQMVHLNLFFRVLAFWAKTFLIFLLFNTHLSAQILAFFNPIQKLKLYEASLNTQGFIASDPVSLDAFFNNWQGKLTAQTTNNYALAQVRTDLGIAIFKDTYLGYFYRRNIFIRADKDFVRFFYALKNNLEFKNMQYFFADIDISATEEQGLTLAHTFELYQSKEQLLQFGISSYISSAMDMQSGFLSGSGEIYSNGKYSLRSHIDYYYMQNLVYSYDALQSLGLGYGLDMSLFYANKTYAFEVEFIANNIFAKTYWNALPFSSISLETENQKVNKKGHIEYKPTIKGIERYESYIYNVKEQYHLSFKKYLASKIELSFGFEYTQNLTLPYIIFAKRIGTYQKISLIYEHRFHTKGIKYQDKNFSFSLISDGFKDASAVGISLAYHYSF